MLAHVVEHLECPSCASRLTLRAGGNGVLRCDSGHSFDIARQGYVNLLGGGARPSSADTTEMVAARREFLASGHFEPLISAVAERTKDVLCGGVSGCVVDVGAGTGEYLAAVLDRAPGRVGLALDISKAAMAVAARMHERIGAVVCDAWGRLPLATDSAAVVMNVFAPRNAAEFARVLAP